MTLFSRRFLVFLSLLALALPLASCKEESSSASPAGTAVTANAGAASALLAQAGLLHSAASQLRSYWLCLDEEISLDSMTDPAQTIYDNDIAPDEYRCHVFHIISGLKNSDAVPDLAWFDELPVDQPYYGDWYFNGTHTVQRRNKD